MKNHDKIATRLAQILNKLNSGESLDVETLVQEFGVSKRTIQRDLNERLSYLPLKKRDEAYYLEEYYLGKLNFDDIKNFAALSGVKELFPSLQEDFLKSILDNSINQAYLIKGHNYEDVSNMQEVFSDLESSITNTHLVTFTYKNKARVIEPYKLLNSKGIWYLIGVEDGTIKTFSVTKITNLKLTDKEFKIKELSDGGLLVSTKVSFDEEILKLVRYWIPHVKIISPTNLQEKLENILREYLK